MSKWTSVLTLCALAVPFATTASTVTFVNADEPRVGFNDPTPFTAEGGNHARTLGEARRNVMIAAAEQWSEILGGQGEILFQAQFGPFQPEDCEPSSGVLGSAGIGYYVADYEGAAETGVWHSAAQATAVTGRNELFQDGEPAPHIIAAFNADVDDDPNCLSGLNWYYGFDNDPAGDIDLYAVAMHEIAHGLGFAAGVRENGSNPFAQPGQPSNTYFFAFDTLVTDHDLALAWVDMTDSQRRDSQTRDSAAAVAGNQTRLEAPRYLSAGLRNGEPKIYTPFQYEPGSTASHFDVTSHPNLLMEPFITSTLRMSEGVDLTTCVLADGGFPLADESKCPDRHAPNTPPVLTAPHQVTSYVNDPVQIDVSVTDMGRSTPDDALALTVTSSNQALVPDTNIRIAGADRLRTLDITPVENTSGETRLSLVVDDGVFTARSTIDLAIEEFVPQPPVARDDQFVVTFDAPYSGSLFSDNGAGADHDPQGETFTVVGAAGRGVDVMPVTLTSGAVLSVSANGAFTYDASQLTAEQRETLRQEQFSYTIENSLGESASATVTMTVRVVPIARPDTFEMRADENLTGNVLVDNGGGADSSPGGGALRVLDFAGGTAPGQTVTLPSGVALTVNENGQFLYERARSPGGDATLDRFSYTLVNTDGHTDVATVSIFFATPPVARDDDFFGGYDQNVSGDVLQDNGAGADYDPEQTELTVTHVDGTALLGGESLYIRGIQLQFRSDGAFLLHTETAPSETRAAVGQVGWTYTLVDEAGETATAQVRVELNRPPTVTPPEYQVDYNGRLRVNILTPPGNISDPDADEWAITGFANRNDLGEPNRGTANGLFVLHADGLLEYQTDGAFDHLAAGQTGSESIEFEVTDEHGATTTSRIHITTNPRPAPPSSGGGSGSMSAAWLLVLLLTGVLSRKGWSQTRKEVSFH